MTSCCIYNSKKLSYSVNTTLETFFLFGALINYLEIVVLVCIFKLYYIHHTQVLLTLLTFFKSQARFKNNLIISKINRFNFFTAYNFA